jgi:hypothetical protein
MMFNYYILMTHKVYYFTYATLHIKDYITSINKWSKDLNCYFIATRL